MKPLSFQEVIMRLQAYWAEQGCLIWQPYSEKVGAGTAQPGHRAARAGTRAVERGLRGAELPARRWPLRRESQPHADAHPVSGDPEAGARPTPRSCTWAAWRPSASTATSMTSASSRTTGSRLRWARGAWAGRSGSTGWRSPSTPISSRPAASRWTRCPSSTPTVWSASSCTCRASKRSGRSTGTATAPTATCSSSPRSSTASTTSRWPTSSRLKQMYDLFEAEAKSCLAHRLVIPAHDYVLRCSHTFNLLDARGAIGVTERAALLRAHARPGAAGVRGLRRTAGA